MSKVITLDGPASSGKTTVGFQLAQRLGYQFIDSGSIYRAGCYFLLANGHRLDDDAYAAKVFNSLDIRFLTTEQGQRVCIFDEDVTPHLGTALVTQIVPMVGGRKLVREAVKLKQRELGLNTDTIMTGRDIGTEIFPEAQVKYFLTASPQVRAYRRYLQLIQEGQRADYDELLQKIIERDHVDATREVSPFRMPENATVIDTSNLTIEAAVNKMYYHAIFEVNKEGQIRPSGRERF